MKISSQRPFKITPQIGLLCSTSCLSRSQECWTCCSAHSVDFGRNFGTGSESAIVNFEKAMIQTASPFSGNFELLPKFHRFLFHPKRGSPKFVAVREFAYLLFLFINSSSSAASCWRTDDSWKTLSSCNSLASTSCSPQPRPFLYRHYVHPASIH